MSNYSLEEYVLHVVVRGCVFQYTLHCVADLHVSLDTPEASVLDDISISIRLHFDAAVKSL